MRMKQGSCLIILMLVVLSRCSFDSPDIKAAKETIRKYNRYIADGYAKMDMKALKEAATEGEISRVFHHMITLKESKIRLESQLKDLIFETVTVKADNTILVRTKEVWDFKQIGSTTGTLETQATDVVHILSYEVVRQGGRWLVNKVTPLEDKELSRKSR